MYFLVSHQYRYLLGWSAKCGCSSLKRWHLAVHGQPVTSAAVRVFEIIGYGNTEHTHVDWKHPARYADYYKCAVVRNPFLRLVSGFNDKYVAGEFSARGFTTFNEFLGVLERDKKFRKVDRHHFTPQFSEEYPKFVGAGFEFDQVVPIERLADAIGSISARLDIPSAEVPRFNRSSYASGSETRQCADLPIRQLDAANAPKPREYYTPENAEIVRRVYAGDFTLLERYGISCPSPVDAGRS